MIKRLQKRVNASHCFRFLLKDRRRSVASRLRWSDGDRLFHAAGAAYKKAGCPKFSRVRGCSWRILLQFYKYVLFSTQTQQEALMRELPSSVCLFACYFQTSYLSSNALAAGAGLYMYTSDQPPPAHMGIPPFHIDPKTGRRLIFCTGDRAVVPTHSFPRPETSGGEWAKPPRAFYSWTFLQHRNELAFASLLLARSSCKSIATILYVDPSWMQHKTQLSLRKTRYSLYSSCCSTDFKDRPRSMIFMSF